MSCSDPAIRIEDLRVKRGSRQVFNGLGLSVPAGALIGLLGPSGCGKSTLMRSIVGVQRVVSGTITVLGSPAGDPGLRRRVGHTTQAATIYDDLTVRQKLGFFCSILIAPRSDIDRVIEETDLTDHAADLVGSLSGGQRSRASLAAALLGSPELLILDEPTVGLDPVSKNCSPCRSRNSTTFWATPSPSAFSRSCRQRSPWRLRSGCADSPSRVQSGCFSWLLSPMPSSARRLDCWRAPSRGRNSRWRSLCRR